MELYEALLPCSTSKGSITWLREEKTGEGLDHVTNDTKSQGSKPHGQPCAKGGKATLEVGSHPGAFGLGDFQYLAYPS